MNDDPLSELWPVALSAISLFASGIIWAIRAAAKKRKQEDAGEIEFERTMIRALEGAGPGPPPIPREAAPRKNEDFSDLAAIMGVAPAPALAPAANSRPAPAPASPFVESIIFKLSAAGLLENADGALRCSDPSITGRVLELGRGRRVCVVDSPGALENPALAPFLQHYEGAILPGPGGAPVFVKRFETLISDAFKF